jgi:transposase-like protein
MSGAVHSTYEIRLRAVRAVLDEQLPIMLVARAYGTDRSTVHRWIGRFQADGQSGLLRKQGNGRP